MRRAITFILDYCGWRWIQDDPLTAILAYLAIAAMIALVVVMVVYAHSRGAL